MITTIKQFKESLYVPTIRVPKEINNTTDFRSIDWKDIQIEELGDDGNIMLQLGIILPGEKTINDGIVLDIQLINNELYQMHLFMCKSLQSQGLGYKIIKKFISEFGHFYSGNGRALNDIQVPAILNKMKVDADLEFFETETGNIVFMKGKVDKNLLEKYK